MAVVLIIIGLVMVIAAVRNTVTTQGNVEGLVPLVQGDFSGQNNFVYWVVSILIIGAIGYIPSMKNLSNAILALVIIVLFLSKGGFFQQFQNALQTTTGTPSATSNVAGNAAAGIPTTSILSPFGANLGGI